MSKHTPGPWKVRNNREVFCGNKRICSANAASREPLNMKDDLDVSSANARLIAAAPDLLEALREYRAAILFAQDKQALMSAIKSADDKARAAIAKAEEA